MIVVNHLGERAEVDLICKECGSTDVVLEVFPDVSEYDTGASAVVDVSVICQKCNKEREVLTAKY